MDASTLLLSLALAVYGALALIGGWRSRRLAWGDLTSAWRSVTAHQRVGMGLGVLVAAGLALAARQLLERTLPPGLPPLLGIALPLLCFALGMVVGSGVGLAVETAPKGLRPESPPSRAGTVAASDGQREPAAANLLEEGAEAPDLLVPTGRIRDYRWRRLARLPGALLLGDVALIGLLDLLFLPRFTSVEVCTLGVFPGALLLLCAAGEGMMRRLARVPLPPCSPDAALAQQGDVLLRARMIAILLEQEVYAVFILVVCQWLLRAFSPAHPGSIVYNGLPLVYAVVLFSLRGLLEQEQRRLSGSYST
jgi:hypothetical protein